MSLVVGVIGPSDLVGKVAEIVTEIPGSGTRELVYQHETEAVDLVRSAPADVEALLFTGVIPYTLAYDAGLRQLPADYVRYSGATLLRAFVQLLREGHDITRLSIDTLGEEQVHETFADVDLSADLLRVLEYRPGLTSKEIVDFHRDARDKHGTTIAITCLRSAYDALRHDLHALRLAPSVHSIRAAARSVVFQTNSVRVGDAQVAMGFIETSGERPDLRREMPPFGGSLTRTEEGLDLVVTTRGLLEQATSNYARLPMLSRLRRSHETVHIGFGIGRSAAEAEAVARRALSRARAAGPAAAAVAIGDDADVFIDSGEAESETMAQSLPRLARRAGLNQATLQRLCELVDKRQPHITALEVAEHLGVEQRTARRILKRLERAGAALPIGIHTSGRSGRPRVVYYLNL